MHIPDGYLSPQTYIPTYAVIVPLWWKASAQLKKTLRHRQVPLLALGAAFSFVIMMFNIPIIGGTTGHAVGAVLIAILLGPWAAMIAVSLALVVQALMFGDGGVTAIGANCLSMAFLMPFSGWAAYRFIARSAPVDSRRHWVGAAVGGYVGLNVAALSTAFLFGIQPLIAHDAAGRALYCPFGLKVALPIMCGEHLLVFGFVEAIVTGLVISYIQRVEPALLQAPQQSMPARRMSPIARAVICIGILVMLSPLGLYLPARFGAGTAWGEWSAGEIGRIAGYVPREMRRSETLWRAPMPDYAIRGGESASLSSQGSIYILSGIIGAGVLILITPVFGRLLRKDEDNIDSAVDPPVDPADDWNTSPVLITYSRRRSMTRRAAEGLAKLLADTLANDEIASRRGLLQSIDARAKILGLIGLIVVITLVHTIRALAMCYAVCVLLAILSRIPARRLARVWIAVPLFSAAIMLPATLSMVTPGSAVMTFKIGHNALIVTDSGLLVAGRFVLRSAVCVSLALLLTITTHPVRLFRGLRALGVPRVFIMLLTMMERYIGVLARSAEDIHLAKISRSIAPGPLREEQAWVASGIGSLFRRTRALGNAVYMAMVSRGYTGEVYLLDEPRMRVSDWVFLAVCAGFAAMLLMMR